MADDDDDERIIYYWQIVRYQGDNHLLTILMNKEWGGCGCWMECGAEICKGI